MINLRISNNSKEQKYGPNVEKSKNAGNESNWSNKIKLWNGTLVSWPSRHWKIDQKLENKGEHIQNPNDFIQFCILHCDDIYKRYANGDVV